MKLITLILLAMTSLAQADDIRTYSNGMTCFQNRDGFTYGCSGGTVHEGETYMDIESGKLINQIDRDSALDIETGRILITPGMPYRDDGQLEQE